MTPWLTILGIGADGIASLTDAARARIAGADLIVGGARHLAMIEHLGPRDRLVWDVPLSRTIERLRARQGSRVVVLATGDPLWFGVGTMLIAEFGAAACEILPHLSCFQLAAARLGWPIDASDCITVHGRPLDRLRRVIAPGVRLLVLCDDGGTPSDAASLLRECGYGASAMTALSELGATTERRVDATATEWSATELPGLTTLAIACRADDPAAVALSLVPGLPDDAFLQDGQLTKRPIRAATLALLSPLPGECLWDVGAGCGSIAIEWLRVTPRGTAIAIERDPERLDFIRRNAITLGVPELSIVEGTAPAALIGLPMPDAVFIGGGVTTPGLMEQCYAALRPGGRLVANVVTLDGEAVLLSWFDRLGGELTRLQAARAERVGPHHGWRPLMPVTQWMVRKPA